MIWYDMIWYDMIWYDMIWYDIRSDIWYDMIWYDMIWYDMIWYDTIRWDTVWYDKIYLFTAIGLPPGGSSTVHICTQTINRTQSTKTIYRITQLTKWEECGPCPVFASYTLAFTLQLRKKHGKTSVRIAEKCQLARWKQNIQNRECITIRIYKHTNKNT